MKTKEFLELLNTNKDKSLLFEYEPGAFVGANYHITEIKNTTIDSVDCGAGVDFWQETVIQLWESPSEKEKTTYMSSQKALNILNKVNSIKPMVEDAEVKFEYNNANFHTAQLYVDDYVWNSDNLVFKLSVKKTDCKAKETCGVPAKVKITPASTCAPGSGCC